MENKYKNENVKTSYKGVFSGLAMFTVGALLVAFNIGLIESIEKFYPKLTAIGFIMLYFGFGLLIAPGKKEVIEEGDIWDTFYESSIWTKLIWIIYGCAGIGIGIYVISSSTWKYCTFIAAISVSISAFFFFIKFLYFLCKKPVLDQYGEKIEEEYNYYNPSKKASAVCMILFFILALYSGSLVYKKICYFSNVPIAVTNPDKVYSKEEVNEYVETLMENDIPVRLIYRSDETADVVVELFKDLDTEEVGYQNLCVAHFNDIVKCFQSGWQDCGISQIFFIDSNEEMDFTITAKEFRKLKCVKNFLRNRMFITPIYFNVDRYYEKDEVWLAQEENLNEFIVVNYPDYTGEYIMVWDLENFTEYFNRYLAEIDSEDEAYNSYDILEAFYEGYFDSTMFRVMDVEGFRKAFFEENDALSVMFNFGLDDSIPIHYKDAYKWLHIEE